MKEHKGFDASPKKAKEARKKGEVVKSPYLIQACLVVIVLCITFNGLAGRWLKNRQVLEWCLSVPSEHLLPCAKIYGFEALWISGLALGAGVFVVALIEGLQVGLRFYWEPLMPQLNRLNPVAGLKKISQGFVKIFLVLLKLGLILVLAKHFILNFALEVKEGFWSEGAGQLSALLPRVVQFSYFGSAILLCFGLVEYLYNRKRFINEHSMSHDEVRREQREDEGDPHAKSHRKALREAMLMQEIVRRVRSSKVIIVE